MKTFFNMLGPLVNPAMNTHQLVGVFNLKLSRLYQYLFENSGKKYQIIHAVDGYDEVSLTGATKVVGNDGERLIDPDYFGLAKLTPESIYGGESIEDAAKIFTNLLDGKGTDAQEHVVLANASLAIKTWKDKDYPIADCMAEARASLESGAAYKSFKKLISLS